MQRRHPDLPKLWLVSDVRNDDALETALHRLPRGSGFIFRHHHLPASQRRTRFDRLRRLARTRGHTVVLAGSVAEARRWGADGVYGNPRISARGPALLRLATAHSLRELRKARRADAVLLSPVFATRSHPAAAVLGAVRFRLLAAHSKLPVLALGGVDDHRARRLAPYGWAAVDGLAKWLRKASCTGRSNK